RRPLGNGGPVCPRGSWIGGLVLVQSTHIVQQLQQRRPARGVRLGAGGGWCGQVSLCLEHERLLPGEGAPVGPLQPASLYSRQALRSTISAPAARGARSNGWVYGGVPPRSTSCPSSGSAPSHRRREPAARQRPCRCA